jgi:hypothetical protein
VSNDNEKSKFLAFRCPTKLYEKMFNVIDNGDRDVTATLIHNLDVSFYFKEMFDKIINIMTEDERERIIKKIILGMDPTKVDDINEFTRIYERENRQ